MLQKSKRLVSSLIREEILRIEGYMALNIKMMSVSHKEYWERRIKINKNKIEELKSILDEINNK